MKAPLLIVRRSAARQILAIDVGCGLAMIDLGRAKRRIILYLSARGFDLQRFSVECRRNLVAIKEVARSDRPTELKPVLFV